MKMMTAILLILLAGSSYPQEKESCYRPDKYNTICELPDGRASVTYFDAESGTYLRYSYTAQEWKDSAYRKSLTPVHLPPLSPPVTTGPQHAGAHELHPVYTGPRTKNECKAAGYKWVKGTCNGLKVSDLPK
jgi:hypothetical protein